MLFISAFVSRCFTPKLIKAEIGKQNRKKSCSRFATKLGEKIKINNVCVRERQKVF
jgi:hypothetical protein